MRCRALFSGLVVTSLLGGPTLAGLAPVSAAATDTRLVRQIQRVLEALGYRPGPIDGIVGPRTQAALVRYQRAEGIAETGYLDAETMVRLDIRERVFGPVSPGAGLRASR